MPASEQTHQIAARRVPVLIVGSPAQDWAALTKWTSSNHWREVFDKKPRVEYRAQFRNPVANMNLEKDLSQIALQAGFFAKADFEDATLLPRPSRFLWQSLHQVRNGSDGSANESLGDYPSAASSETLQPSLDKPGALFAYLTTEIRELNRSLLTDVSPHDFWFIGDGDRVRTGSTAGEPSNRSEQTSVDASGRATSHASTQHSQDLRVWFSRPLVVAPEQLGSGNEPTIDVVMHYDTNHNFNAGIVGRKTFLLLPPSAWQEVMPNPVFHPSDRHSRVPLATVAAALADDSHKSPFNNRRSEGHGSARQPNISGGQLVYADVGPGEVLYIPPFYFHAVETNGSRSATSRDNDEGAINAHINVNAFSMSREWETMLNLSSLTGHVVQALLKEAQASRPHQDIPGMVAHFLRTLIPRFFQFHGERDKMASFTRRAGEFLNAVLDARWRPLPATGIPDTYQCVDFEARKCPLAATLTRQQLDVVEKSVNDIMRVVERGLPCDRRTGESGTFGDMHEHVAHTHITTHRCAVRELLLADFIEGIALVLFRQKACHFLQCAAAAASAWV